MEAAGSLAEQLCELSKLHGSVALTDEEFVLASASVGRQTAFVPPNTQVDATVSTLSRLGVLYAAGAFEDGEYVRAVARALQSNGDPVATPADSRATARPVSVAATSIEALTIRAAVQRRSARVPPYADRHWLVAARAAGLLAGPVVVLLVVITLPLVADPYRGTFTLADLAAIGFGIAWLPPIALALAGIAAATEVVTASTRSTSRVVLIQTGTAAVMLSVVGLVVGSGVDGATEWRWEPGFWIALLGTIVAVGVSAVDVVSWSHRPHRPDPPVTSDHKTAPKVPHAMTAPTLLILMLTCGEVLSNWLTRALAFGIVAAWAVLTLALTRALSPPPAG